MHGRKSLEALLDPVLFGRDGARTLTEVSEEATRTNGLELDAAKAEAVRGALIPWFEENGRDLPWRRTRISSLGANSHDSDARWQRRPETRRPPPRPCGSAGDGGGGLDAHRDATPAFLRAGPQAS